MYVATNKSSRAYICGSLTLLPHVPCQVTETDKETILNSRYGENFVFEEAQPASSRERREEEDGRLRERD